MPAASPATIRRWSPECALGAGRGDAGCSLKPRQSIEGAPWLSNVLYAPERDVRTSRELAVHCCGIVDGAYQVIT
jgi:hypothetical protein